MRMKSRWGLAMLAIACLAGMNSCAKAGNPGLVTQSFMWVATTGDQMVRSYTIQLDSGVVAQVGDAIATGLQPQSMGITPDGRELFIANTGDSTIGVYTVNSDGTLKLQGTTPSSGQMPVALAVDPTGQFLFVADQNTSDVSAYQISSTSLAPLGALFLQTPSPAIPATPSALAVSPVGGFLYVADSLNNTVVGLSYDNTGVLAPLPATQGPCGNAGYCVQVGTNPSGMAFSRCAGITNRTLVCGTADNDSLFVSNAGSNTVSVFSACIQVSTPCPSPNGTLTAVGTPVAACCGPTTFMVDPAADFVYVLEAGAAQVGEFSYAPVTGTLSPLSPGAVSTGTGPSSGGITANSTSVTTTNWVFVSNAGGSSISGFRVTSAGRLGVLSSGPFPVPAQPVAILLR
jgi:DNA-binding beta-propeller fold protein YncE